MGGYPAGLAALSLKIARNTVSLIATQVNAKPGRSAAQLPTHTPPLLGGPRNKANVRAKQSPQPRGLIFSHGDRHGSLLTRLDNSGPRAGAAILRAGGGATGFGRRRAMGKKAIAISSGPADRVAGRHRVCKKVNPHLCFMFPCFISYLGTY